MVPDTISYCESLHPSTNGLPPSVRTCRFTGIWLFFSIAHFNANTESDMAATKRNRGIPICSTETNTGSSSIANEDAGTLVNVPGATMVTGAVSSLGTVENGIDGALSGREPSIHAAAPTGGHDVDVATGAVESNTTLFVDVRCSFCFLSTSLPATARRLFVDAAGAPNDSSLFSGVEEGAAKGGDKGDVALEVTHGDVAGGVPGDNVCDSSWSLTSSTVTLTLRNFASGCIDFVSDGADGGRSHTESSEIWGFRRTELTAAAAVLIDCEDDGTTRVPSEYTVIIGIVDPLR